MRLNNKGWGTSEMILLSCGLLIALLVSVFFISQLYKNFGKEISNNYLLLETDLAQAAEKYIKDKHINVEFDFIVNSETLLLDGYINELKDKDGNLCNGYVKVSKNNYNLEYKGYIKCKSYETPNYNM